MSKFKAKLDEEGKELQGLFVVYDDNMEIPDDIPVTIGYSPDEVVGHVEEAESKDGEIHVTVDIDDEELFEEKILAPAYMGEEDGDNFIVEKVVQVAFVDEHVDPDFENNAEKVDDDGD